MTVKKAIDILQTMNPASNLVAYTPCGPEKVTNMIKSDSCIDEVIVDVGNGCCDKLLECNRVDSLKLIEGENR